MAQRPKPEVRDALLRAAAEAFAEAGFEGASLGDVVARAGSSIGNFYKYFANKDELFAEFLPAGFPAEVSRRIRTQVESLRDEPDVFALDADHPYRQASEELLAFTVAHRERMIFLLLRATGTPHERFANDVVKLLVELALEHTRARHPGFVVTAASRRSLVRIYRAFVATLGAILAEERAESSLRAAVSRHATYHLTGLGALLASMPTEETSV